MDLNIKKIGISAGIFIGAFLVLLVAAYFLYPFIEPEEAEQVREEIEAASRPEEAPVSASLALSNESTESEALNAEGGAVYSSESDSQLVALRNRLESSEIKYQRMIDSLETTIEELTNEYEEKLAAKQEEEISENLQSVTKALLNLDVEELSPIVNRLQDHDLIKVYQSASNMQREKLLRSLEPQKASKILIEVMS